MSFLVLASISVHIFQHGSCLPPDLLVAVCATILFVIWFWFFGVFTFWSIALSLFITAGDSSPRLLVLACVVMADPIHLLQIFVDLAWLQFGLATDSFLMCFFGSQFQIWDFASSTLFSDSGSSWRACALGCILFFPLQIGDCGSRFGNREFFFPSILINLCCWLLFFYYCCWFYFWLLWILLVVHVILLVADATILFFFSLYSLVKWCSIVLVGKDMMFDDLLQYLGIEIC